MIGLESLLWIYAVLKDEDDPDEKLDLIFVRQVLWCYIFLFIVRCSILGAILLPQLDLKMLCITTLLVYIICSILSLSDYSDHNHKDSWERLNDENRMTLLDIKEIFYHINNKL